MAALHGFNLLIDKVVKEHDRTKEALQFCTRWVDLKFKDGARITSGEYQEFLDGLSRAIK